MRLRRKRVRSVSLWRGVRREGQKGVRRAGTAAAGVAGAAATSDPGALEAAQGFWDHPSTTLNLEIPRHALTPAHTHPHQPTHPPTHITTNTEEAVRVEGNEVRIVQHPGWVFGDVALLFNSSRTASVVAATDVVLWAIDRATFLAFVMKHAAGARALRFVRKVGASGCALYVVVSRVPCVSLWLLLRLLGGGDLQRSEPPACTHTN
jgi:hypothetical protein